GLEHAVASLHCCVKNDVELPISKEPVDGVRVSDIEQGMGGSEDLVLPPKRFQKVPTNEAAPSGQQNSQSLSPRHRTSACSSRSPREEERGPYLPTDGSPWCRPRAEPK